MTGHQAVAGDDGGVGIHNVQDVNGLVIRIQDTILSGVGFNAHVFGSVTQSHFLEFHAASLGGDLKDYGIRSDAVALVGDAVFQDAVDIGVVGLHVVPEYALAVDIHLVVEHFRIERDFVTIITASLGSSADGSGHDFIVVYFKGDQVADFDQIVQSLYLSFGIRVQNLIEVIGGGVAFCVKDGDFVIDPFAVQDGLQDRVEGVGHRSDIIRGIIVGFRSNDVVSGVRPSGLHSSGLAGGGDSSFHSSQVGVRIVEISLGLGHSIGRIHIDCGDGLIGLHEFLLDVGHNTVGGLVGDVVKDQLANPSLRIGFSKQSLAFVFLDDLTQVVVVQLEEVIAFVVAHQRAVGVNFVVVVSTGQSQFANAAVSGSSNFLEVNGDRAVSYIQLNGITVAIAVAVQETSIVNDVVHFQQGSVAQFAVFQDQEVQIMLVAGIQQAELAVLANLSRIAMHDD